MGISIENAEHYVWGEVCDGWHLVKSDALSVVHERVPPGGQEIRHVHQAARQFFFVLSGVATLEVGTVVHTLHAREGLEVAPREPHQFRNEGTAPVEFLVISHPSTGGDRVNETV